MDKLSSEQLVLQAKTRFLRQLLTIRNPVYSSFSQIKEPTKFGEYFEKEVFEPPVSYAKNNMLLQIQEDTGNRKDILIDPYSCFTDLSDCLNMLISLNFCSFKGKLKYLSDFSCPRSKPHKIEQIRSGEVGTLPRQWLLTEGMPKILAAEHKISREIDPLKEEMSQLLLRENPDFSICCWACLCNNQRD